MPEEGEDDETPCQAQTNRVPEAKPMPVPEALVRSAVRKLLRKSTRRTCLIWIGACSMQCAHNGRMCGETSRQEVHGRKDIASGTDGC